MKVHLHLAVAMLCCALPGAAFASHGSDDNGGDSHNGQTEHPDGTVARGPISAVSPTGITVGGLDFTIDGTTVIKGAGGAVIDTTGLAVGDIVKVEGTDANGTLLAKEIELEDDQSSSADNHHDRGGSKSNVVIGKCSFPGLELARQSLEKSIRTTFSDAGVTAKVKVKFKITAKDPTQDFTGISAANGVVVSVDPATGSAVTLSGAIAPLPCAGTIAAKVEVRVSGAGTSTVSTATLPITGEYLSKDQGRN